MILKNKHRFLLLTTTATGLLFSQAALAYIGPGAGLTVIGTVIALIGAVLLAIVGFIWYPIKRLRAKLARKPDDKANENADEQPEKQDQDEKT